MLMSVVTKVAMQINCKLGGELWALEIPVSPVELASPVLVERPEFCLEHCAVCSLIHPGLEFKVHANRLV